MLDQDATATIKTEALSALETKPTHALRYEGKAPYLELNADEIAFPVDFEYEGEEILAFFHFTWPPDHDGIKSILNQSLIRQKASSTGEMRMIPIEDSKVLTFVDQHFRDISGVDVETGKNRPQVVKDWLDANPNIKARAFRLGYDGIYLTSETPGRLVIGQSKGARVLCRRTVYDPAKEGIVDVLIDHRIAEDSEKHRRVYRKAISIVEKGRIQTVRIQWDTIEGLYDRIVSSVTGFRLNGEELTASNKNHWISQIPLLDKVFVVNNHYKASAAKNAS